MLAWSFSLESRIELSSTFETKLGLFRHGQTDWNIDFKLQGTTDTLLNDHGVKQVIDAAEVLHSREDGWDVLLTSPLMRARQSSKILARKLGLSQVIETPLLIERSFGVGEGLTYEEWQQHFKNLDEIPGAETAEQVLGRANELLRWISAEFAGKRVLAVSHGALIRYVLNLVSTGAVPPPGERLQNASLHILNYRVDNWELDAWAPNTLA